MDLIGPEELTFEIGALVAAMNALPVYKEGNPNFLIKVHIGTNILYSSLVHYWEMMWL